MQEIDGARLVKDLMAAYEIPAEGSGAGYGWTCVANLVMYWINNPDKAPRLPSKEELDEINLLKTLRQKYPNV